MAHDTSYSTAQAQRVIAATATAWGLTWPAASTSARALARQAPHGYVPLRALRRMGRAAAAAAAGRGFIAHSW
jgi:hypothetical protein